MWVFISSGRGWWKYVSTLHYGNCMTLHVCCRYSLQGNCWLLPSGFKCHLLKIYKLKDHLNGNKWSWTPTKTQRRNSLTSVGHPSVSCKHLCARRSVCTRWGDHWLFILSVFQQQGWKKELKKPNSVLNWQCVVFFTRSVSHWMSPTGLKTQRGTFSVHSQCARTVDVGVCGEAFRNRWRVCVSVCFLVHRVSVVLGRSPLSSVQHLQRHHLTGLSSFPHNNFDQQISFRWLSVQFYQTKCSSGGRNTVNSLIQVILSGRGQSTRDWNLEKKALMSE